MSWGEGTCKLYGDCTHDATIFTCNSIDCPYYEKRNDSLQDRIEEATLAGLARPEEE